MKKHIKSIRQDPNETLVHVIIPSAGIGRRMKSYGCKSLLNIRDKKLIDIQVENIRNVFPTNEIILVTGFDSDRLINNSPTDIIKIENERYYDNNVIRSISIGMHATKDNDHILIVLGDLLFNTEALSEIDINQSSIIISNDMDEGEVGCNMNGKGYLEYMMFDLSNKWGHILYLTSKELTLFKKLLLNKYNDKKFCFEIVNQVINQGGKFKCIVNDKIKTMDIYTSKDLQKAQEFI